MHSIPKVTIVTRTRNRTKLLERAIKSVLSQSLPDWHHVIVNDGGDPAPVEALCEKFTSLYNERLSIMHSDHVGMQNASNYAIENSKSEYLAIHDDDDAWHEDFLQETTAFLDQHGSESKYQGVIGKTERIKENELEDGSFVEIDRQPYIPLNTINIARVGYENPFPPIAFLYRRSVHETIGMFDPDWDLIADLDFNFRFLLNYEIGVIDKVLAYYHWRQEVSGSDNHNTVSAQRQKHTTLLNEYQNNCLRQAVSAEEVARALTFIFSRFSVENQWMTSDIRDHSIVSLENIQNLKDDVDVLKRFNDQSLWPKVEGLDDLRKQIDSLRAAVLEIQRFHDEAAWPKLESVELNHKESQNHLNSISLILDDLNQAVKTLSSHLSVITSKQEDLANAHLSLSSEVQEIRKEQRCIREEYFRHWKVGRLKLTWLKPGNTIDSSETGP